MSNTTSIDATVRAAGEGDRITVRGNELLITGRTDRLSAADSVVPPAFAGPPAHVHPGFDEVLVVLEGTLTVRLGDAEHTAGPGATVTIPGAVPHTFANRTAEPVRFLAVLAPGGYEEFLRALGDGDEERAMRIAASFGYAEVD